MKNSFEFSLAVFLAVLSATDLAAQSGGHFEITQSVIAGGGTSNSGSAGSGDLGLTGTIGRPVADVNSFAAVSGSLRFRQRLPRFP